MRSGMRPGFVYSGDTFVGINLSAAHCAEHEWGIKKIHAAFGHDEKKYGVERRRTRLHEKLRDHLCFFEHTDGTWVLAFHRPGWDGKPWTPSHELYFRQTNETLASAWDEGTFAIRVHPIHKDKLDAVYNAILAENAVITLGGGGAFQNAGLVIAIIDKMPEAIKKMIDELDRDYERLQQVAKATGIEDEIRAAGLKFFALSPKWISGYGASAYTSPKFGKNARESAYHVVFWLNPWDQQNNNFGWYTVEELREWVHGRGPVLKGIGT